VPTVIDEERIRLTFRDPWNAIKWDAKDTEPPPRPYRDGIERLKGELDGRTESTKAVDVVAVSPAGRLCLIEIKDFRTGHGVGGGPRAVAFGGRWKDLPIEVALKVRDTLAGLCGVVQRDDPASVAGWVGPALGTPVLVVAFIAQDAVRSSEPASKRAARDSQMLKSLRQKLAWLTTSYRDVLVLDPIAAVSFPRELGALTAA
jgi:hypothetical protein